MTFKPIQDFNDSLEGKLIRFKADFTLPNLSSLFGINNKHTDELYIPAGALGVIYEVRGETLFIGFGGNLTSAPPKYASPATFAATVQVYLDDIRKLEIGN